MLILLTVLKITGWAILACICSTLFLAIVPWIMLVFALFFKGCKYIIVWSFETVTDIAILLLNKRSCSDLL